MIPKLIYFVVLRAFFVKLRVIFFCYTKNHEEARSFTKVILQ
jgi:hypothetical protein